MNRYDYKLAIEPDTNLGSKAVILEKKLMDLLTGIKNNKIDDLDISPPKLLEILAKDVEVFKDIIGNINKKFKEETILFKYKIYLSILGLFKKFNISNDNFKSYLQGFILQIRQIRNSLEPQEQKFDNKLEKLGYDLAKELDTLKDNNIKLSIGFNDGEFELENDITIIPDIPRQKKTTKRWP